MIQALATAIEKDPFKMHDGARYLREWVVESQQLHPALDVSIISSAPIFAQPLRQGNAPQQQPVALEPAVGQVRVERGRFGNPGGQNQNPISPKMEVVCGIAESFRSQGLGWEQSFDKAFELWKKLHVSVQAALNTHPDPVVDAVNAAPAVANDQGGDADVQLHPIEDDSADVLEPEQDF
eukprot:s123_g22.t1